MKGVSPVIKTCTGMFHISRCTKRCRVCTVCIGPLDTALYCTLNSTMRPLTSLQGVSPSHWTEMEEELLAVAIKLSRTAVESARDNTQNLNYT